MENRSFFSDLQLLCSAVMQYCYTRALLEFLIRISGYYTVFSSFLYFQPLASLFTRVKIIIIIISRNNAAGAAAAAAAADDDDDDDDDDDGGGGGGGKSNCNPVNLSVIVFLSK